jgi:hypothetical protein
MKNMTNSSWAAVFIFMACVLACISLFSHSSNAASVITIASSIITGAFGYIQGKKDGESASDFPPNSSLSTTTVSTTAPEVKQ